MFKNKINNTDNTPLVSIRCITYNHEPYIRQCLEGFVMQQTNFKFEAIVHDDASTDGTAAIVAEFAEKYPDIIKPIYQTENQWSKRDGSLTRAINPHLKGKYIAMCEGDDYWIDPLKLQKQVDFLEANPGYGLVCSSFKVYDQLSSTFTIRKDSEERDISYEELLNTNRIGTLTVVFLNNIFDEYRLKNIRQKYWKMGDYPIWCYVANKMKIRKMKDITSVYRKLPESASHSRDKRKKQKFVLSVIDIFIYFLTNYPVENNEPSIIYNRYFYIYKGSFKI